MEDDHPVAESLRRGLGRYGFEVDWVTDGRSALAAAPCDLVLLDLGLPDTDGLDVCRELRARGSVPIIVISARAEEVDRVVGLELGADDYVSKPFGMREVIARIRAVLRRSAGSGADNAPTSVNGPLPERLVVDRRARRVLMDGAEVALTPREYDLLAYLATEPGRLFTREQIMESVWDTNWFGPTKTLDVHIGALRRKLGAAIALETVRGVGFRLVAAS
ncbi:DNA-binding response regulator [Actinoplanes philippinensis]|uniref:DNA-binding response regulator, OmpR family, contains REC and winged-helix (WHTH) domain n=1 Tax=Actinoplanes philippinensis TaxID=35752 RepID=A0A1I2E5P6_9ACTN|nr:DNA-binding response regulator [Actinoplanes philippinensis]SFE88037.1 DNA-binding response regulator, OmpR family, contains REC and winged-helix (wHTH) domain [Actinoplanes philippinensis]